MPFVSIALDGPSGAGKSTLARRLAEELGYLYVDTGAIYRTVGLWVRRNGADPKSEPAVSALLSGLQVGLRVEADGVQHMYLNGEDVTGQIREPEISMYASAVSALPAVRAFLLEMQRELARTRNVVMDGRDIGTVVLPEATVKVFLTAAPEVRARRRWLELQARGNTDSYEQVLADVMRRDEQDMNRAIAPLRPAADAVRLDTSKLDLEESGKALLRIVKEKLI
ncbi:MAG TPA: (d)CMP kinase [Candidatus Onthomonas avicola]|nr:(d)CMP kinase [Candidatus Onthomonas avicola]